MGNIDGCAEQYRCVTAIYLLSIFSHAYNIIIDCGVGAPGHGRELFYGLNATNKRFIFMLITTLPLLGTAAYESQMVIHTSTANTDIILTRGFQGG